MCVSRIKRHTSPIKKKIKADVELRFSFSRDFLLAQQPVAVMAERAEEGKRGRSEGSSTGNSEFDALCEEESEDGVEGKRVKVKRTKGTRRRKREDEEWDSH